MKKISKNLISKWSIKMPLYIKKNDKHYNRHMKQLKSNGFSDTETWCLDKVIAEFILPRLIRFKGVTNAYPGGEVSEEAWNHILDKMIFAFKFTLTMDKWSEIKIKSDYDDAYLKYKEGMELFTKYFHNLGW